jgi:hypothetical protein
MVGRLTRRIYIYGLDGLVGIPENFDRFAPLNMREMKQLQPASNKSPHYFAFGRHPLIHSRIKSASSNFQWQLNSYGGNVCTSFSSQPGASRLAPIRAVHINFGRSLLAHARPQIFMAAVPA